MLARPLQIILWVATGVSIVCTLALYNHARITCLWKWSTPESFLRMVVFADPQMEGDAKIARLGKRAIVDLAFNDAYMRHIFKTMTSPSWSPLSMLSTVFGPLVPKADRQSTAPTHISILGDLFSSQWIDDQEFHVRLARYRSIFVDPASRPQQQQQQQQQQQESSSQQANPLNSVPVLINITGNHDIGYGYDISQARLDRWEQAFGRSNFIQTVDIPDPSRAKSKDTSQESTQRLHLVILNTMLLDGPSSDENLHAQTWQFVEDAARIKERNPRDKIVLLTHIPFHKEQGICIDPPDIRTHWDSTIIEQTMLTPNTTNWILNHLKPDFVLNGHDHYGCDVTHIRVVADPDPPQDDHTASLWVAYDTASLSQPDLLTSHKKKPTRVREITQRSMMAEFGGYSGLFEIRRSSSKANHNNEDEDKGEKEAETGTGTESGTETRLEEPGTAAELEFHYTACGFYTDVTVWTVIIIDLVVAAAWSLLGLALTLRPLWSSRLQRQRLRYDKIGDSLDKKQKLM
ncbi:hypothetical protein BGZ68_001238 [Mortierella alpina]|nr:hypothetical protein BGZ68_001238 [Mortierella alpina]